MLTLHLMLNCFRPASLKGPSSNQACTLTCAARSSKPHVMNSSRSESQSKLKTYSIMDISPAGAVFELDDPITLAERYDGLMSEVELDFLAGPLQMDPGKRLTGQQCLRHPYLAD